LIFKISNCTTPPAYAAIIYWSHFQQAYLANRILQKLPAPVLIKVEFVGKISISGNNQNNPSVPTQSLKQYYSMGNTSFNFGLRIDL
jgi:hypothetical protein